MKKCTRKEVSKEYKKSNKLLFFNVKKKANKDENKKDVNKNENKKSVNKNENKPKIEADSLNINNRNIYISKTGKCFHLTPNCGRVNNMTPCSISYAKTRKLRLCNICFNHNSKIEFSPDNK